MAKISKDWEQDLEDLMDMDEDEFDDGFVSIPEYEGYTIENESAALWAIDKIKHCQEIRDNDQAFCKAEAKRYHDMMKRIHDKADDRYHHRTDNLMLALDKYFEQLPQIDQKSQRKVEIAGHILAKKKPKASIVRTDEDKVTLYAIENHPDLVEYKTQWGELKKHLEVGENGAIIDTSSGQVVDPEQGLAVETSDEELVIKYRKEQ